MNGPHYNILMYVLVCPVLWAFTKVVEAQVWFGLKVENQAFT